MHNAHGDASPTFSIYLPGLISLNVLRGTSYDLFFFFNGCSFHSYLCAEVCVWYSCCHLCFAHAMNIPTLQLPKVCQSTWPVAAQSCSIPTAVCPFGEKGRLFEWQQPLFSSVYPCLCPHLLKMGQDHSQKSRIISNNFPEIL